MILRTALTTNSILLFVSVTFNIHFASFSHADEAKKAQEIVADQSICRAPGTVSPIPDEIWDGMQGTSWHAGLGCPTRAQLRYLRIPYLDFSKHPQMGEMIAAQTVAEDVLSAFTEIYCSQNFMIDKMRLIYQYEGSDPRSMNANNTSGFNCRFTSSGKRLSEHSFGKAIDINPVQNPYVSKGTTSPTAGHPYNTKDERIQPRQGMIRKGDVVTRAFARINWKWGGDWHYSKDYQHFSSSGR